MFKNKILKSFNKGIFIAMLSSIVMLPFLSVESKADVTTYYIRTLFDDGNFGIISQVVTNKVDAGSSLNAEEYLERAKGINFSAIADYTKVYKGGGSNSNPGSSLIANIVRPASEANDTYKEFINQSDANMGLVFSFPGLVNTQGIEYTAKSSDLERAELVSNTLTKGLNDALMFVKTHMGVSHVAGEGLRHTVAQLSRITSHFSTGGAGTGQFTSSVGNKTFYLTQVTGPIQDSPGGNGKKVSDELIPVNDLLYDDYVAISVTSGGKTYHSYFPWRMKKGYHNQSILGNVVGPEYRDIAKDKENLYLTWGQLAIQAAVNSDYRNQEVVDSATDVMTLIGQGLGSDLTGTITSVRSMLNLSPIQELILNMGARSTTHYHGVMTQEMYNTAKTVYVLVLVVSLLFLSALIVKMIHQKMISTTNIIAKTSLMEGMQDIMFVGVMLAFFPSIFEILLELNYWIVKTFSFSNEYLLAYGVSASKVLSTESLAGFIVSSMFLSIDVYINTTYLVRAIVVSFLFAISPVLTVSYCWGPMQKKLYFSYMRELVGNIFMQSFHAITMTFFAGYNTTNMSSMEAIASAYCFIPVTQLFRQLVIGSQGGFSESLGGKLAGQLTNTATGMHKSSVAMKQSKEMLEMNAANAKSLSSTSFYGQAASELAQFGGEYAINSLATNGSSKNGEIGQNKSNTTNNIVNNNKTNALNTASGGFKQNLKENAIRSGLNVLTNGGASYAIGNKEEANRNALGKLQMEHSMENMGIGLAQTGMGIGISSFEGAAGNAMVGAGLASVQSGAAKYGEGIANTGQAGHDYGVATGYDNARFMVGNAMASANRDYSRASANYRKEYAAEVKREEDKQRKDEKRGMTQSQVLSAMGIRNAEEVSSHSDSLKDVNQNIEIRPEAGTNNVTFQANAETIKKMDTDNSTIKYLQTALEHGASSPEAQKALEMARKDGFDAKFGGNGTGFIQDGDTVSFVMKNMNAYGMEFDESGKGFSLVDKEYTKIHDINHAPTKETK